MNKIFNLFLFSGSHSGRYYSAILLSAVSAVVFLVIFKTVSNQKGIKHEKARIIGNLFQMRLYKDDLLLVVSSFLHVFKHNLFYIRYMLVPFVAVLIPLIILTVQVNQRCGYNFLKTGEEFIITVDLDNSSVLDSIECLTTDGINLLTPAMRIYENSRAFWRARIKDNHGADERVYFYANEKKIGAKIIVTNEPEKSFTARTVKFKSVEALFYNAEGFLPSESPVRRIIIEYPRATYSFFWIDMDAVLLYFILTLIFVLAIKPFFRVTL